MKELRLYKGGSEGITWLVTHEKRKSEKSARRCRQEAWKWQGGSRNKDMLPARQPCKQLSFSCFCSCSCSSSTMTACAAHPLVCSFFFSTSFSSSHARSARPTEAAAAAGTGSALELAASEILDPFWFRDSGGRVFEALGLDSRVWGSWRFGVRILDRFKL